MNRLIALTLLFALFITRFTLHAQDASPVAAKADSLLKVGDVAECIPLYREALAGDPENSHLNYNLACAYALSWNRDSAFHFLNLALVGDTSVVVLTDPDLINLSEDERWAAIEDGQIAKVGAKFGPYPKPDLARELWRMKMKDQAYYYHIHVAEQKIGRGSPVVRALWDLKKMINDKNEERLEEIINEQGWPKESDVKGNAAQAAFLIIQHANLEKQKQYIGMLKSACEQGEASWPSYALMYDRIEMREGRPQFYGSQVRFNAGSGQYEPHEILEPEYVNKRRREVGLGPIQDYLSNWDIKWEVEQKE
ncbi:MAG: hypothetical protein KDC66_23945 [Phaeodactylibacter sp.]|nr:hypothetical protein [Phaeodactylibacter sp.]MCB9276936.1 hypothetical protein [Lewinellaceae bacterium]